MDQKINRTFEIAEEILYIFNEYIEEDEDDDLCCDIMLSLASAFCEFTMKHTITNKNRNEVLEKFNEAIRAYPDFFKEEK